MTELLSESQQKLLELASKCSVWYEEEKKKFPYHINIIRELHDNENAHSRILMQLLRYKDGDRYPILESFIQNMGTVGNIEPEIDINTPQITNERERIDGLIEETNKYAIIVENKIWGAADQNNQIERYVDAVIRHGIPEERIFVIYLTKDGLKLVSDWSLTEKTKEILQERFIPMNFKHHILPWLKEEVLPNCKMKEEFLHSAVHQYIDYLEDINGLHDYQKQAQKNTIKKILKEMGIQSDGGISTYYEISEKIQEINQLKDILSNQLDRLSSGVIQKFTDITKDYFSQPNIDFQCVINEHFNNNWCQVYDERWDSYIHLEWIPVSRDTFFEKTDYTLVLHLEGGIGKTFREMLSNNEEFMKLPGYTERNGVTLFKKVFTTKDNVPFGLLPPDKQKEFLYGVYDDEEIQTVIRIVFDTFEKMRNNNE